MDVWSVVIIVVAGIVLAALWWGVSRWSSSRNRRRELTDPDEARELNQAAAQAEELKRQIRNQNPRL
ncbi:hypothetical protein WJX64_00455 [Leifsonia sp. YIM 134122]|uniref:Uncharacterized protein n=1 Tax=Leifsonia stereocauli TaxID=3134136 RepID=A0ABU9VZL5_9MICO